MESPRADECHDVDGDDRGWDEPRTESESAPSLQQVSNTESAESAEDNESPSFEDELADAPGESPKEVIQHTPRLNLELISNFQPLPENSDKLPSMYSPSFEEKLAEALAAASPKYDIQDEPITKSESAPSLQQVSNTEAAESAEDYNESPSFEDELAYDPGESPKEDIQYAPHINLEQISNFQPLPENSDNNLLSMDSPSFEEKLAEALGESPKNDIQHAPQINLDQISNFPPQIYMDQLSNFTSSPETPRISSSTRSLNASPETPRISSSTRSLNADSDYDWKRTSKVDSRMPPRYLPQNRPREHVGHRLYAHAAEIEEKKAALKEEMDMRLLAQMRSKPQLITKHTRSASFGSK
eukprot:scaffold49254_cov52-Attheya_sp.AAC.2